MANFFARVWIDSDLVESVEVFVFELEPPRDGSKRSVADWVRESLSNFTVDDWRDMFKLPKEPANYELVFEGTITGHTDSFTGEYDEDVTVVKDLIQRLPDDWFDPIDDT